MKETESKWGESPPSLSLGDNEIDFGPDPGATPGQTQLAQARGARLRDLAAGIIGLIEQDLEQREIALRLWAEEAVIQAGLDGAAKAASRRLGMALACYGGIRDLWLIDADGQGVAWGRNQSAVQDDWATQPWFASALAGNGGLKVSGSEEVEAILAVPLRDPAGGPARGVLAARLDWPALAGRVVGRVRQRQDRRSSTRCLLINAEAGVLAASDGSTGESFPLRWGGSAGFYLERDGVMVGYARSPRGWCGVVAQRPRELASRAH